MKYRIIRIFEDGEWFYIPQVQKRFLFFKYWTDVTGYMYLYQSRAERMVEYHSKGELVKNGSVVKEITNPPATTTTFLN